MMQIWKVGHFMHLHTQLHASRVSTALSTYQVRALLLSFYGFVTPSHRVTATSFITFSDEAFVGNSSALSHGLSFFSFNLFPTIINFVFTFTIRTSPIYLVNPLKANG